MPISKARVKSVNDSANGGLHTVKLSVYNSNTEEEAPVLMPTQGCVWLPKEGDDVAVMFSKEGKPWVIGSWYAVDRLDSGNVELPDYEEGDLRLGNSTGSHVTIESDGTINIVSVDNESINIDKQSAVVYHSTAQTIPNNDTYYKVEFDTIESDEEDLYDETNHQYVLKHDGDYRFTATLMFPTAGQNNRYTLAIFINGVEEKRRSFQSSVNAEMSLDVSLDKRLNAGDEISVYIKQNSGSDRDINGSSKTNDFILQRKGI
jgi:hypothetical protein